MSENSYHFDFSPLPEDDRYLPQISAALEDLTNARSRKRMPGLWKLTDRLNARKRFSCCRNRIWQNILRKHSPVF